MLLSSNVGIESIHNWEGMIENLIKYFAMAIFAFISGLVINTLCYDMGTLTI